MGGRAGFSAFMQLDLQLGDGNGSHSATCNVLASLPKRHSSKWMGGGCPLSCRTRELHENVSDELVFQKLAVIGVYRRY